MVTVYKSFKEIPINILHNKPYTLFDQNGYIHKEKALGDEQSLKLRWL
jgi:hypothetical protein